MRSAIFDLPIIMDDDWHIYSSDYKNHRHCKQDLSDWLPITKLFTIELYICTPYATWINETERCTFTLIGLIEFRLFVIDHYIIIEYTIYSASKNVKYSLQLLLHWRQLTHFPSFFNHHPPHNTIGALSCRVGALQISIIIIIIDQ